MQLLQAVLVSRSSTTSSVPVSAPRVPETVSQTACLPGSQSAPPCECVTDEKRRGWCRGDVVNTRDPDDESSTTVIIDY